MHCVMCACVCASDACMRINIFSLHLATVIHKNISNGKFAMDGKMLCALSHVEHNEMKKNPDRAEH